MAQWEMCCVASVSWNDGDHTSPVQDYKIVLRYFTPTGVITKFPSSNSWGQVLAILGAAEWEAITMQHGLQNAGSDRGWAGSLRGMYVNHPSGEKIVYRNTDLYKWKYDSCHQVAYFKRLIQAGRQIDHAL